MKRRLAPNPKGESGARSACTSLALRHGILLVAIADVSLSFDSLVIVAGMAANPLVMVAIILIEVFVILIFSQHIAALLRRYPTIETLAICALLLMGANMILRAIGIIIPETVIYAMIGFALVVEFIDMRIAYLNQR